MPLHLKASAQAGIQGNPIFDPVGTNEYIKHNLVQLGWRANIPIPLQYNFLGTSIDLGKAGALVEVQFSHYAFLLNNTIRAQLFFNAQTLLTGQPTKVVFLIAKALMFPASNSSLYYEQAVNQLTALAQNNVFDVPLRLIGLFEQKNTSVSVKWTVYEISTSRTVVTQQYRQCEIIDGRSARSRYLLRFL